MSTEVRTAAGGALSGGTFRYVGYTLEPESGRLVCRYDLDGTEFEERITFPGVAPERFTHPSVDAAARRVHLLAGISYYKTRAPAVIHVPDGLTPAERALLTAVYREGLGEFAHVNGLDMAGLVIDAEPRAVDPSAAEDAPSSGRPLVPFGGGIDSIVSVELLREAGADIELFVMSRPGDHFEAIERPAGVTGRPIIRAYRELDPKVLDSPAHGYLNGHVPVTGILSTVALLAAVLWDRDAVVMSNELSASAGSTMPDGSVVNHQWSKSLEFEQLLRAVLKEASGRPVPDYFSLLRPLSELWIARRFAGLEQYHGTFCSCNKAFLSRPEARAATWCSTCDKCCFIDLILSPFMDASALAEVFGGHEPLGDRDLATTFEALLGVGDPKPFECVGDVDECRVAAHLGAGRPDRSDDDGIQGLRRVTGLGEHQAQDLASRLLRPSGPHHVPTPYAPADLLD